MSIDRKTVLATRKLAVIAAVVAITASACGSSSQKGTSSSQASSAGTTAPSAQASSHSTSQEQAYVAQYTSAPTTIEQSTPLNSTPPRGKSIVMLGTSNPSNVEIQKALSAAAGAVGWSYSEISFDSSQPASLQAAANQALLKHPSVVVEDGNPLDQFGVSTLTAYANAGIPILLASVTPVTLSKYVLGTPDGYTTEYNQGVLLANWFVSDSNGHGNALIEHVPAFPVLGAFTDGFQQTVAKECPACVLKFADVSFAQVSAGQTLSVVTTALKSDPSAKYLISDDGDFVIGINAALAGAGITGVKIAGVDVDAQGLAALRNHTESAWVAYSPYYTGYAVMDLALRWVEGMPTAGQDDKSPEQLLTPQNVGSTTLWNQPSDALQQFEKLWKVPATPCDLACQG